MSVTYDTYYGTEDLFGDAYPELVEYFQNRKSRGKVLDLGCGQGRDAIAIARLGYEVLGIDNSQVGIDQMIKLAKQKGLSIEGQIADVYQFEEHQGYDVILFDSMFHFLKKDREAELALVNRAIQHMKLGAELVVCIQDMPNKVSVLMDTLEQSAYMAVELDTPFKSIFKNNETGHMSTTDYRLIVAKKSIN